MSGRPPVSTSDPTREKLEAWLRYYEDLGLRHFYRGRVAPAGEIPASPSVAPPAARLDRVTAPPATSLRTPGKSRGASEAEGSATWFSRPPDSSPARIPILPIAQGPSLFEAVERIEDDSLERIRADIGDCTRCRLHKRRNNIVFGVGSGKAELVFVGEGPGNDEDLQGIPFVGRAGRLLTQMIEAMGLQREDVYICNVVKCRPPENRTPEKDEIATCSPFLLRQLAAIGPKVIVCLGNVAAQALLGTNKPISHFRGEWLEFRGARLLATYHPAYLLRNPAAKVEVWKDLKKVMKVLGLQPKKR